MLRNLVAILACCAIAACFNCDDAGKGCATVYQGATCGYERHVLKAGDFEDLRDVNYNDVINSVVVTRGCFLFLFEKANYKGDFRILVGNANSEQYYKLDEKLAGAASSASCVCDLEKLRPKA